jgi:thiol-disulfide isomerase/thioredoxin
MRVFGKTIMLLSLALILLLAGCGINVEKDDDITPASDLVAAPDFPYLGDDGSTVTLSDLQGQVVVLNFWATWCAPCRYEMPYLERAYKEYADKGVVILAVNVAESADTVTEFLTEQNLNLPVLLDTDRAIAAKYGINSYPTTLLVDRDGNISRSRGVKFGAFLSYEELRAMIETALSEGN